MERNLNNFDRVYIFRCKSTGRIKVGRTRQKDIQKRLKQIQAYSPTTIEFVRFVDLGISEKAIHNTCRGGRLHGEWFDSAS